MPLSFLRFSEIHPLVIEDVIHGRQTYSSKADYYNKHLFVRMLCHTLKADDDHSPNTIEPNAPRPAVSRSNTTPPPAYESRTGTVSENQAAVDHKFVSEDDLNASQGTKRGLFGKQGAVPTEPGSRVRTLAGTSFSGAQPWMSGSTTDPEKVWARSAYANLGGSAKRSNARKYSMQLASMFESNVSLCYWDGFLFFNKVIRFLFLRSAGQLRNPGKDQRAQEG